MGNLNLHFTDFFNIDEERLNLHGLFNISLINDFPLFIDPFLLFENGSMEYRTLHNNIIKYIAYLRDRVIAKDLRPGEIEHLFYFPEIKQNWLGYSLFGNSGNGLGKEFSEAMLANLFWAFGNIGSEEISEDSHVEKLCIIKSGAGRDNISDFTANLIKDFLLEVTQNFAINHLDKSKRKIVFVEKAFFNYETERWVSKKYDLPYIFDDFVLLTPKNILTKDENWINSNDLIGKFDEFSKSLPNTQLRDLVNRLYVQNLPAPKKTKRGADKAPSQKDISEAIYRVIEEFPEYLDYYIKYKEDLRIEARRIGDEKVNFSDNIFIKNTRLLVDELKGLTDFYKESYNSHEEALRRVKFLKQVIENNNGYKLFYVDGKPIKREKDIQVIFRLTWFATKYDVNSEIDNGRGSVDYKISFGKLNSVLVEFKLASNSKLEMNLKNQTKIYEAANKTKNSIRVIMYFSELEKIKIEKVIQDLKLQNDENIVLIDARNDNKASASIQKD
jgi:hypothetical protein